MPRMLSAILSCVGLLTVAFIAICALLYFKQESLIFYPHPNDPQLAARFRSQRVEIPSAGATLEGWWAENPGSVSPITLLYFGGNGEDVLYSASTLQFLNARRMLVVNYRGYGRSTGEPSEDALYKDALAIYDWAVANGTPPADLVVMGRSLGSGVATKLAGSRPVRSVVLITPFDSLAAVAAGHYPIVPVRWLLRHPFPSVDWAKQATAPVLMLAAQRDTVVPARHAQALFEAWPGKKQIHVLPETGHNDIERNSDYYRLVNQFLAEMK